MAAPTKQEVASLPVTEQARIMDTALKRCAQLAREYNTWKKIHDYICDECIPARIAEGVTMPIVVPGLGEVHDQNGKPRLFDDLYLYRKGLKELPSLDEEDTNDG